MHGHGVPEVPGVYVGRPHTPDDTVVVVDVTVGPVGRGHGYGWAEGPAGDGHGTHSVGTRGPVRPPTAPWGLVPHYKLDTDPGCPRSSPFFRNTSTRSGFDDREGVFPRPCEGDSVTWGTWF